MALNSIKVKKEQKMNWIKENKIRIIMIAVALLAVIGTVIVVTRRSGKAQTTDNNQSDVVINESPKEDVTTKKDDVIKESESTTEADKEEETTSKDDKNVEEETTPAAAEPTTPYVAPTTKPQAKPTTPYAAPTTKPQVKPTKPQAKPTKPQPQPTKPQPTRPTEPATTAPVIHGKDGVILDTLYFNFNRGLEKLPESQAELGGPDHGKGVWTEDVGNRDIFGVGIIMGKSTKEDVEAYFGKPLYEKDTENGMVIQYAYKNVYLNFNFYKDTGKIRLILIDGVKGLDDV